MGARAGLSPAAGRAPDGGADGRTRAPHRVLVVSTTHDADHPRLRDGTVAALAADPGLVVRYATPPPGPERRDDHEWVALPVARPARALAALAQALRRDVDVVSLHGASLLGVGMAVRAVRRVPVVLDVDEDLPQRIQMAEGAIVPLRGWVASGVARLLRAVEGPLAITVADPHHRRLFAGDPPVVTPHPLPAVLPDPVPDGEAVVCLGDVTPTRGAFLAVQAVARMAHPRPLVMVGRCPAHLAGRLRATAEREEVELTLTGPLPPVAALELAAGAAVGLSPLLDLPSHRVGPPWEVLACLAVGVPVVVTNLPGIAAAVGGLPGVRLVPAHDPWALAAALDAAAAGDRPAARGHVAEVRRRFGGSAGELRARYRALAARGARA